MSRATAINVEPSSSASPYRWVALALAAGCFVFTFIVRWMWSPLIPIVAPVLGINMSQAGAYMSAFFIGYVVTQIPAGVLADRFGARTLLAGSLMIEGVCTFLMAFISGYDQGFALRVAIGVAAGADYACCARVLVEWFPPRERGTAFGVLLAGPSTGLLLANLVVPPLTDAFGWRGAFELVGAITLLFGFVVYRFLQASGVPTGGKSLFSGFRVVFSSRDLLITAAGGFFLLWMQTSIATWANASMKQAGISLTAAAQVMMLYSIGGIAGSVLSGVVSDRFPRRVVLIIAALLLLAPLTVLFGQQASFPTLLAFGFVLGLVGYLASPQQTVLVSQFAGKKWAATANGVQNFIQQLASIAGPFVLGLSVDLAGDFRWVWWIMAAGPLLGAVLMFFVREDRQKA